ncbi:MAG: hypothetical protein AAF849_12505 [Bacteroidota bacterium]
MDNPHVDNMPDYNDQITVYFNPKNNTHEKTVAHAKGGAKVLAIPFESMPEAYNIWMDIWKITKEHPEHLFDEKHPKYESLIKGQITNFQDWRNIILHNRDMIAYPIAMNGNQVIIVERQTQVHELLQPAR